ncbi:hypothetical protein [Clostridium intestinale]|jgi:hypothetical protein|uniref:Uncharacterized protein n=2 Tax=Clostridium intestinale TaxID=36845 RepID=U2N2R2_9CLOT|nr:hypothetical protein [Clostridium intestinale]ERK29802.1 hypothetical protein CINTURNW_2857 [Clostridium intestinale URNW]QLY81177.1 hypothetical protein HZF06_06205 [Clostridium intestinale]
MVKNEIIKALKEKGVSDIEEIKYKRGYLLVKFFYDFDDDEISAARSYSNEEGTYESETEEWFKELYLPYLYDISLDNVEEYIEEITEEYEIQGQFVAYDVDINNPTFGEFLAIFSEDEEEVDIDEVVEELDL